MPLLDRRKFLFRGLQLPAALLLASKSQAAACVDPDELSASVQGMRDSLEYQEVAADAKQACNGCSFFKPEKPGANCGYCEVLTGPVDAKGHCVSWTKRA